MNKAIRIYQGGIYVNNKGETITVGRVDSKEKRAEFTLLSPRPHFYKTLGVIVTLDESESHIAERTDTLRNILKKGKFRFVSIAGYFRK